MKTADFTYHRPSTIDDALQLLDRYGDDAKVMAGGQSLLPIMRMRLAEPAHVVDVAAIPELRNTSETATGRRYGAAVTHMMVEDELVPDVTGGLLREVAAGIAHRAIRTKGTIGGSLVHSDSAAEWPTVMAALGATAQLSSASRGSRRLPIREFLQGFFTTALEPDELLVDIEVPELSPDTVYGFHKLNRKIGDFADSLAVALRRNSDLELWLGAARDVPTRLTQTEQWIGDRGAREITVSDLAHPIGADLELDVSASDAGSRHSLHVHAAALRHALIATEKVRSHG